MRLRLPVTAALRVGDLVRRDPVDEGLERLAFVPVPRQGRQYGDGHLLSHVVRGVVGAGETGEARPAQAMDRPVDGAEQGLDGLCVPLDRAGGEPLHIGRAVLRSDYRAMRPPCYRTTGGLFGPVAVTCCVRVPGRDHGRLPHQTPAETDGDRLSAVGRAELAEETPSMRLDG